MKLLIVIAIQYASFIDIVDVDRELDQFDKSRNANPQAQAYRATQKILALFELA